MAGKRAVSRARRTVVHHRDTLARTRVLLAARAGVPVARSDARRKKDSKRGNGYVVRVAAVARVFPTRRRARGGRAAPAARRRDTDDPSARAAPSPPPIGAIPRALAHAAGARRRAEATPRPRSPALSRSSRRAWLWCFLSPPLRPLAPRRASCPASPSPDANDVTAAAAIVAVARRRRARHGRRPVASTSSFLTRRERDARRRVRAPRGRAGSLRGGRRVCPRRRASSTETYLSSARTRSPV